MKRMLETFYRSFGPEVVFLDLETTGIDPLTEKIMEVGAVRIRGGREMDRFHSLVNPGIRVPYRISALTGIADSMLGSAPRIEDILGPLARFIGNCPIFAHNSEFERRYLQRHYGEALRNRFYDTCYFACLVLPDIRSYSLESLMQRFGLRGGEMHRALEDAVDARRVMEALISLAPQNIPRELVARFQNALRPDEEMVVDFLRAVAALHELPADGGRQQIMMFEPPGPAAPAADPSCRDELCRGFRSGKPTIVHAGPEGMRRASLGRMLAEETRREPTLLLVPEHDTLERWQQAIGAGEDGVLYLERIYHYICPSFLEERIEQALDEGRAGGFDLYLKLLLQRERPLLRHHVSSFLLHREEGTGHRLELAAESRWDCQRSRCGRHHCLVGQLEGKLRAARLVVTFPSNLYILQRLGRLGLLPQQRVVVDGPEHIEEFFDPHLESIRLSAARELFQTITRLIEASPCACTPRAVSLAGQALRYAAALQKCLEQELEGVRFRQALLREWSGLERVLCHLLDLYIPAHNLEKELDRCQCLSRGFWFCESHARLHRFNAILNDFFQTDGRRIRYIQPEPENKDIQFLLKTVDVSESFRRLAEGGERRFLLTTAVGDRPVLRDFVLRHTGLDHCGDFETLIFSGPDASPPSLLIPTDRPEFTIRNHPGFLEGLADMVLRLEDARGGHTVVVLNSVARMRRLASLLADKLDRRGVLFLQQHHDGGRDKLLRTALTAERCLILGSQAFYSGVGIDDGGVDTLIIEKVPFPFHKDELVTARRRLFRSRGYDDFDEYMVPQAVLKLRGAVRQIRPGGLFVIADGRVQDTGYFQVLCSALSPGRIFDSLAAYLPWAGKGEQ